MRTRKYWVENQTYLCNTCYFPRIIFLRAIFLNAFCHSILQKIRITKPYSWEFPFINSCIFSLGTSYFSRLFFYFFLHVLYLYVCYLSLPPGSAYTATTVLEKDMKLWILRVRRSITWIREMHLSSVAETDTNSVEDWIVLLSMSTLVNSQLPLFSLTPLFHSAHLLFSLTLSSHSSFSHSLLSFSLSLFDI